VTPAIAQNLESIGKSDPLKITGGFSSNQVMYFASGITDRRSPYTMFANANLNINIYGWSAPFSFLIWRKYAGRD
jgi:hypothetical protein